MSHASYLPRRTHPSTIVPSSSHASLRTLYDRLWRDGRAALAAGTPHVDPLPVEGGARWGISAVLRPTAWPPALTRCTTDVRSLMGTESVLYDPAGFHLTVRQFESHRTTVPRDDAAVRAHADALRALARDTGALALTLRGLTASPGGVLVQGWPRFDLEGLRRRLQRLLEETGSPMTGPETTTATLRTSAHATLSLFTAMFPTHVARRAALSAYIDAHRDTFYADLLFDRLWLVGYARTATTVRLIEYGCFPFGATAGSSR